MFINLSNHPLDGWSREQISAAVQACGLPEIIDLPFPAIPPEAGHMEVHGLACEMRDKVVEMAGPGRHVVHVMGEMTFVHAFVDVMRYAGVSRTGKGAASFTCVASTTRRIAMDGPDGTKTSRFEFVQFRKYV